MGSGAGCNFGYLEPNPRSAELSISGSWRNGSAGGLSSKKGDSCGSGSTGGSWSKSKKGDNGGDAGRAAAGVVAMSWRGLGNTLLWP